MSNPNTDPAFLALARALAAEGRELSALGYTPATSSNFSARADGDTAAITISGRDKGKLGEGDIMRVDFDGRAVGSDARPSAETLLHTQLYKRFPAVGAVLHTHSPVQTIASKLYAAAGGILLQDWELLKAFTGFETHESELNLPVFANQQDMPALAREIDAWLDSGAPAFGYLIEGHGLYAWGRNLNEARRHLDAFEFLLHCEIELRKLAR